MPPEGEVRWRRPPPEVTSTHGLHRHITYSELCDEDNKMELAVGKATSILGKMESGKIGLESESVYGSAIAMPQIASNSGWSWMFTCLAARSWFFLSLNVVMQGWLILMIGQELHSMSAYAGKMHLCNFGANIESCPDAADCRGPGGTEFTYPRLYNFNDWSTRKYVKESLLALFPKMRKEIEHEVDPGEYGVENSFCRYACVFIFSMAVVGDLFSTTNILKVLWKIPTGSAMPWISYEEPCWGPSKAAMKEVTGMTELDLVKFRIGSMPWMWKLVNLIFIVMPKIMIWCCLVSCGFRFLMETSGISDCIINCIALTFILDLDEMIFNRMSTQAAKTIMSKLEDYALYSIEAEEAESVEETLQRCRKEGQEKSLASKLSFLIPRRFFMILIVCIVFICKYYYHNCDIAKDGSIISTSIYIPRHAALSPLGFLFGVHSEHANTDKISWKMPGGD